MEPFLPSRAFFEPAALDYPLGEELYNKLQNMKVPVNLTGSHNRVSGIPGETPSQAYREAKRTLVVGVKRISSFSTCKPSAHFQLPLNTSCSGMCEYCYLSTTLGKRPYIRIYVNIDEILEKAKLYIADRSPGITLFEGAATSDPIPTEYLTGLLRHTINFFGEQALGRFRFVTKFSNVNSLLDARHNGHTRFRFSINVESVINKYEHSTPPLEERLSAAIKVAEAGYLVGFIIAPLFLFDGWRQEYGQLISRLAASPALRSLEDLTFELITHRFTSRAKANILSVFPQTTLPMEEENRKFKYGQFGYGKFVYEKETIIDIREYMTDQIKRQFPGSSIEYCV
jgi:spore photoproduct lyase